MLLVQPVGKVPARRLSALLEPGLRDIDSKGLICDPCDYAGCPPHGRYVQAVLKVSRSSSELIAAYAYSVYAEAIAYAAYRAAVVQGG